MRETLGRAMSASDLSHEEWECHVDRLGAMARGSALGSAMLWASLSGSQQRLFGLAESLSQRIGGMTNRPQDCLPIAALAIVERMYPHCRECGGAGEGKNAHGVLVPCPKCDGIGRHRYSDSERGQFVGMSWRPRLQRLLDIASFKLSGAESAIIAEVRIQLERDLDH